MIVAVPWNFRSRFPTLDGKQFCRSEKSAKRGRASIDNYKRKLSISSKNKECSASILFRVTSNPGNRMLTEKRWMHCTIRPSWKNFPLAGLMRRWGCSATRTRRWESLSIIRTSSRRNIVLVFQETLARLERRGKNKRREEERRRRRKRGKNEVETFLSLFYILLFSCFRVPPSDSSLWLDNNSSELIRALPEARRYEQRTWRIKCAELKPPS